MPLSPPAERALQHTRQTIFHGYRRTDGLWDIEAELKDTKLFQFSIPGENPLAPGEPVHHMLIRLTFDTQLVIHAVDVAMDSVPHPECPQARAPMQKFVGATLGRGWRKTIDTHLGGIQGCTHLRELLFNMATAAFQSLSGQLARAGDTPPPFLGQCMTWDFDGPAVQRHYPVFFRKNPRANTNLSQESMED